MRQKEELILYRLFQLGIISDWLVTDHFRNTYKIYHENISDKNLAKNVFKQIKKYEKSDPEIDKHKNKVRKEYLIWISKIQDLKIYKKKIVEHMKINLPNILIK